jgi:hypothetical protein
MKTLLTTRSALAAAAIAMCLLTTGWSRAGNAAATHHRAPPRGSDCKRLHGLHGRDAAPAPRVKLVWRRNREAGLDLLGCVLPRGAVNKLASTASWDTGVADAWIEEVAGAWVMLGESVGDQYGERGKTTVVSIRSGRSYTIASYCNAIDGSCKSDDRLLAMELDLHGRSAVIVAAESQMDAQGSLDPATPVVVEAFAADGTHVALDSGALRDIPAAGLALDGDIVSWQHAGEARSATLP